MSQYQSGRDDRYAAIPALPMSCFRNRDDRDAYMAGWNAMDRILKHVEESHAERITELKGKGFGHHKAILEAYAEMRVEGSGANAASKVL